jgi:ribosome biogenesis GTP-binding protein YlqF
MQNNNNTDNRQNQANINWYPGHMAKAKRLISERINLIDLVFEVLDARMPYSSKIKDIESYIKNKPKVIIMTKIDLCDKEETNKWIKYYENIGYYVIPLNLTENKNITKIITNVTDKVMKEANQIRENKGMKTRKVRALVVGIPNAGKSTLINRLAGKKAANVGNKPGVTKSLDWIRINEEVELLDTPGILWPKLDEEKVAYNLASLTAIKEEILPLDKVVLYILNTLLKYYPDIARTRYGIEEMDEEVIPTLDLIGKKRGCLSKGGVVDYDKLLAAIMTDIKTGIIKGITFDRIEEYDL